MVKAKPIKAKKSATKAKGGTCCNAKNELDRVSKLLDKAEEKIDQYKEEIVILREEHGWAVNAIKEVLFAQAVKSAKDVKGVTDEIKKTTRSV